MRLSTERWRNRMWHSPMMENNTAIKLRRTGLDLKTQGWVEEANWRLMYSGWQHLYEFWNTNLSYVLYMATQSGGSSVKTDWHLYSKCVIRGWEEGNEGRLKHFYVDDDLFLLNGVPVKELKQTHQNAVFVHLGEWVKGVFIPYATFLSSKISQIKKKEKGKRWSGSKTEGLETVHQAPPVGVFAQQRLCRWLSNTPRGSPGLLLCCVHWEWLLQQRQRSALPVQPFLSPAPLPELGWGSHPL